MQIIVTGHGNFATGLASTVQMLAGQIKGVSYLDFTEKMSEEELAAQFEKALQQDETAVFFCDLLGGTPYKQAVLLTPKYPSIAVVAGCNLGALLEIGRQAEMTSLTDAHQLAQQLLTASEAALNEFQPRRKQRPPEQSESDGI